MSDYATVKTSKFSFKGEKKKKKKSRKSTAADDADAGATASIEPRTLSSRGWWKARTAEELTGPLFIVYNTSPLLCLAVAEETHRLRLVPVYGDAATTTAANDNDEGDNNGGEAAALALHEAEPGSVAQVFVCNRLSGTTGGYTLRSATGRYLSADKFGVVTCNKEAAGPTEEWQAVLREDGIAWQSVYGKFLSVEETSGQPPRLRADTDNITFREVFHVKCQSDSTRSRKRAADKGEVDVNVDAFEDEQIKRYQSWGGGRARREEATEEDKQKLKRAKRSGQLAQALLDRREQQKADRYCK